MAVWLIHDRAMKCSGYALLTMCGCYTETVDIELAGAGLIINMAVIHTKTLEGTINKSLAQLVQTATIVSRAYANNLIVNNCYQRVEVRILTISTLNQTGHQLMEIV